ncbi:hypothetical protein HN747_03860 [archaeon]|jgi:hypothetical protein|nr:hypothetical protein [archaeon]
MSCNEMREFESGSVELGNKNYEFAIHDTTLTIDGLGAYDFETKKIDPKILSEDGELIDDLHTDCARGALFSGYHHCCSDCQGWYKARDNLKQLAFELDHGAKRRSNWKFNLGEVAEGGID